MWWLRLAALWGCPIWEAKARCTATEFREWVRLFGSQPWGDFAADLRAARVGATLATALGAKGVRLSDIIPWLDTGRAGRSPTPEEWLRKRAALMARMKLARVPIRKAGVADG